MTTGRVRRVSSNSTVALSAFAAIRALVIIPAWALEVVWLFLSTPMSSPCRSLQVISNLCFRRPCSALKLSLVMQGPEYAYTQLIRHLSSNKTFKTSIYLSSVCVRIPSAERREMLVRDHADLVESYRAAIQGARLPCLWNNRHQSG